MKRKILVGVFFLALLSNACKKDFLNKTPNEDLTVEDVFSKRQYAEAWLSNVYYFLPEEINFVDPWGRNPFVSSTDEMKVPWPEKYTNLMNSGAWNASDEGVPTNIWNSNYDGIRKANIFLANVDKVPIDDNEKKKWTAEATFLRAFFYFSIIRTHGPVPLITEVIPAEADFSKFKRAPLKECIDFVVNECDKAVPFLDAAITEDRNYGKVTKSAALALKARILLYAASPLWNGDPAFSSVVDKDGVSLFPTQPDPTLWEKAWKAAKACIDQAEGAGHGLYRSPDNDPVKNYQGLFIQRWNKEILFARNWVGAMEDMDRCTFPNGMGGWSGYSPTQEMVDAYEMKNGTTPITGYNADGSPIVNPASGYVESGYSAAADPKGYFEAGTRNMYVNREPRFYASIKYNGSEWAGRRIEFYDSGRDSRRNGGRDHAICGYLMKKFSDSTVVITEGKFVTKSWTFFRLGEQYLNYAEALNEDQGPIGDVYKYVNLIRDRSGLPPLTPGLSKDQMREKIRHERRIELAFETHRFFDARRWKIAEVTDNKEIHGMDVAAGTSFTDDAFYKRTVIEKRVFVAPKHYWFPIPQGELSKNPNLVQNKGW
ncbi:RagB/SusD family nutrient uptake outer membrane protein [Mucilaginibacter terrigena]|uniref:RagB/SusD family nutrient uptake outer membrane protein n=1 Tax=Mucilaginibacter terrigena TaxID=2492395 RepID=A0A4Q5LMR1_9SPHI|nr:RagB/SusD family nutrient uptake outer membrane protein [Mucilaginibacter terrigena]RYU90917.1 RagB/SusD family nutrient uptake outer membrane protein [Mucilaginibacter terrigena]